MRLLKKLRTWTGMVMLSMGLVSSHAVMARDFSIDISKESGPAVVIDRARLAALPQHVVVTHTPWHNNAVRFEGPLIRDVLALVSAQGQDITLSGLNHYHARMPAADYLTHDVILAMTADGTPLKVRDLGPLFAIYPFDDTPGLMDSMTRARCVWQVNRIFVH